MVGITRCEEIAAWMAASADVNAAAMPSPMVAKTSPPTPSTATRRALKCCSTRSCISGDSSHCRVEPWMSVKRNVRVMLDGSVAGSKLLMVRH